MLEETKDEATFALVVQALPGTGKTTLAEKLSAQGYDVIDSDVVWWNLDGTEKEWEEFLAELNTLADNKTILFTNCWVEDHVKCVKYIKVFPEWNTWIETLMDYRSDLQAFGFNELKEWYNSYASIENTVKLGINEFLGTSLEVLSIIDSFGVADINPSAVKRLASSSDVPVKLTSTNVN